MSNSPPVEPKKPAKKSFEPTEVRGGERKLGRYELLYEIGRGGMANVFLARAKGPAGFQKWVAIKRIHDFLAEETDMVNMFLDEARIAASIQHPNVASVFDLGEASGSYYLAMEYLHGEPLVSLVSQTAAKRQFVSPSLVAYIISRAAAGLHHAHEATDANGQPLQLVHRDISPQNLFITYHGHVKLTDFGIAKAKNRITHTETGMMKGKLAYSAPEQLMASTLDRRTDIFALGVVMWELATGARLFRGETDAETLMRIHSGYRLSPREKVPDFPEELIAVIDRALAQEPDNRYQTAADMARDLDRYLVLQGSTNPQDELKRLMGETFGERIAAKDAVLHHTPAAPQKASTLSSTTDDEPSVSQQRPVPEGSGSTTAATPVSLQSSAENSASGIGVAIANDARASTRRTVILVALVLTLFAVAGIAAGTLSGPHNTVRIASTPEGAEVYLDGNSIGHTPLLRENIETGEHGIRLVREGYEPLETTLFVEGRTEVVFPLQEHQDTSAEPERPAQPTVTVRPSEQPPPSVPQPSTTNGESAPSEQTPSEDPRAVVEASSSSRRNGVRRARRRPRTPAEPPAAPSSATETTPAQTPAAVVEHGYLTLLSRPSARVYMGSRLLGVTPLIRERVRAGNLTLRLQVEGATESTNVRVRIRPNETTNRNVQLN